MEKWITTAKSERNSFKYKRKWNGEHVAKSPRPMLTICKTATLER
jgi:hypothetical protein